jgi:hypothetical protein
VSNGAAALPPLSQTTIGLQASMWNALPLEVRKPLPADGTLIVLQSGALECFLHNGGSASGGPKLELVLRCEHGTWILIERIVKPDAKVLVLGVQSLATALAKQPTPYKLDLDASHFDLQALTGGPGSPAWGAKQGMTFQPSIVYDTTRDEAYLHIAFAKST